MERIMFRVSLRDRIRKEGILRRISTNNSRSRKVKVSVGGAHSSENQLTLGSQGAGMEPHTDKRSVGADNPPLNGQMTSSESQGAAGGTRHVF
ncbi:jg20638 [Pararge aegeria aegeria]|uniref:Jg20638 protein n=1 Tax=Pararge aegeria aegeria TaxID=348720 RepID=A0A8S4RHT6_9NEOP|nr:jg20638 [Pararge aegeria aegeria]